jgi:hypothetical protein
MPFCFLWFFRGHDVIEDRAKAGIELAPYVLGIEK